MPVSKMKWKKYTNVDHLSAYLDFAGEALAEIIHAYGPWYGRSPD